MEINSAPKNTFLGPRKVDAKSTYFSWYSKIGTKRGINVFENMFKKALKF